MAENRILVVEDEINVGETLLEKFKKEGFDALWVKTKEEANDMIRDHIFDLAILDVGLPDGSGFEVAKNIRRQHPSLAIIFLTAFSSPEDRVKGLELGAEDYIPKPFHWKELLLRVHNALKRSKYLKASQDGVFIGKAQVFFSRYEVEHHGIKIPLSQKECLLLRLLVERHGQAVSRDEILDHVWGEGEYPTPRTIDNFIVKLRRIFEKNPDDPKFIRSIRGVGYQLDLAEKESHE